MDIKDINFAIDILSHPQSGDASDIKEAFKVAIESLKAWKEALEQEDILDKIRAEIEALIEWHDCPIEYDNGNDAWYCEACNQAIKIIDKYKAESEE